MKIKSRLILWLLFVFVSVSLINLNCSSKTNLFQISSQHYPLLPDTRVKNVILFIGDGMGLSQITVGRLHAHGTSDKLNLEKMPVTGYLYTNSIDNLITDSAAGATALAAGFKTKNGMIAMLPDGSAVKTILEEFRDRRRATGVVVTCSVTHATPACFAAHVKSRQNETLIAEQLVHSGVDVILGGGKHFFIPQTDSASRRKDNKNLIDEAIANGYRLVETRDQLKDIRELKVLGLFQLDALRHAPSEPSLAEMTRKAIELLKQNRDGFFLMVEGSQIDWGGHANDLDYVIREVLSFDEAVKVGLDFALNDRHTLVLVTADHETGGLAINGGSFDGKELEVGWTTKHHTGVPVPVFAFGPHSLQFMGVHDNTEIPLIVAKTVGIKDFPEKISASNQPLAHP